MADFTTNVSDQAGAMPQPAQPVQDRSSLIALQGLSDIGGKLLSVGAAAIQQTQAKAQQDALNQVVGGFAQKQLAIANAVDTNQIPSQEGRMRMRANYTEAITNNPGLTSVLAKTQKELVTTAGLGSVVAEGTEQEKMALGLQKEAMSAGWIKLDASPAEAAAGAQAYTQFKRHQADIDAQQNQLSLDSAQIGLQRAKIGLATDRIQQVTAGYQQQSSRMSLEENVRKQRSQLAVGGMADSYFFKFNQDLDEIQKQKEANQITPQEAVQLADKSFAVIQQAINLTGRDAGGDYVSNLTAPLKGLYDNRKQFLTGEIDKNTLENQNAVLLGKSKLNLLGNPKMAEVTALSNLLGPSTLALLPEVNNTVVDYLGRNANPAPTSKPADVLPDRAEDKQAVGTYFGVLKSNMGSYNSLQGEQKARTAEELNANITNVLKSIDVHSLTVNNPSDYNQVTDLIASPEYGKFVKEGGGIHAEAAENAKNILQSQYMDKVLPVLRQEFEKAQVDTSGLARGLGGIEGGAMMPATPVAATSQIKPVFSGGGVTFRADPEASTVMKNKAKDLNSNVAKVINKLLRMDAHLNGDTDYKGSYDRNFEVIFGVKQDGTQINKVE
ncbi:The actual alignment was detected with superfamily member TIGR01709: [Pseudomonas phage GP100]|nr:The actual alignment was detected with superfamily member TIGR01709: [Pseudomonas phage GP100]